MPETQTQVERLQSAGLVDSDGFLTATGNFEATMSRFDLEPGAADRYRNYFDRGLIAEDFSRTEDGRIYFMSHEDVLHEGLEAHQKWRELGAWDEWEDQNAPRDPETGEKLPFHKVVGMGLKALATETVPEAATGLALGVRAAQPGIVGKFYDVIGGLEVFGAPLAPALSTIIPGALPAWQMRQAREAAGMSLEETEKLIDDAATASIGKGISEMHRNSVWIAKGIELQSAWMQKELYGTPGDEDHYGRKLFEFEDAMSEFDDQDAIDGMATGQAFLQFMGELVGIELSDEEKYARITEARAKVEKARERFSAKELERLDKNMASGGQFIELSGPLTTVASLGLRLGATATKQIVNLNRHIASHTAKIATMQRMIDKGGLATRSTVKGETFIPSAPLKQRVLSLTDELADMKGQLGKLEANTGLTGTFKDLTRGAAAGTTAALSKTGRALAETRVGAWSLQKIDPLMDAAKVGISAANKFKGFALVAGGATGAVFGGAPVLGSLAVLSALPARYNILRAAFMTINDMGSEFLRRKGTTPYWQRVAEDSSANVWARNGALGMDLFRYPARVASKTAEAGAKGVIAEIPFSMAGSLHLGPEVWAADAISEGLLFGSPGMARGMVHGLGGMPAIAKIAEFDKMALADAAEVRRKLGSDNQRTAFDRLGKEHRREVGVYGATFPDIIWNFDPDATESSWNKSTSTMSIATNSPDPMSALIGHEVAHQIHDRGLTQLVIDELVGPDGALRMTESQYRLSQAKRNERGEIILQTEAELQAERDRARTDESGDVVLPDDPGEAGIDILPDLLPLNEIGQEVKRKYEARKGETIGDDELAIEYYADSVGAALSGNRIKLQELARRHPLVRRLIDGTLNKFAFGREFLLRNGVLFDQYGNPTAGQGVMGAILQSPTLARATETYLRENAGRSIESVSEKAVERAITQADPLTPEDEDRAIREDIVNYAFDDDGNVKFLPNGRPEGIDDETWKGKQNAGLTIIQDLAERYGVEPVTLGTGEKAYRLSRTQWDEVLRLLHESGWYNPRQIKIFQQMIDAVVSGEGDSWHLHYHPVYKTDRVGKKRVPKQGRFAKSKLVVPYDITVSSRGNILFRVIDMDQLQNNAEKAFNTKLGKSLYNNTAEIMRDLETLAKNHRDEVLNLAHFRDQNKVNFLNAIMGVINKEHKAENPLFKKPIFKNFQNKTTAIISPRLDRINRARKANTKALPFRIEDWKNNLMPGPADIVPEDSVVYHTTYTMNVDSIMEEGLDSDRQERIWGTHQDISGNYAFTNLADAVKWGATMGLDQFQSPGSPQVSIIRLRAPRGMEQDPTGDVLALAMAEGDWVRAPGIIPADRIIDSVPMSTDIVKAWQGKKLDDSIFPEADPDIRRMPEQDPDVIRLTGFGPGRSAATTAKLDAALADIEKLGDRNPSAPDLIVTKSGVQIGFGKLGKSPYLYWKTVISTGERRKGHASAVIKELQGIADKHGVGIEGQPEAFDSKGRGKKGVGKDDQLPQRELRRFYKARGFVPHPTKKGWILYEPKAEKVGPSDDIRRMPGQADDSTRRMPEGEELPPDHPARLTEDELVSRINEAKANAGKSDYKPGGQGPLDPYAQAAFLMSDGRVFSGISHGLIFDFDPASPEGEGEVIIAPDGRRYTQDQIVEDGFTFGGYWAGRPDNSNSLKSWQEATRKNWRKEASGDDIRRMPGPADADHRAAVETGDTETAQRMVDEAAKASLKTVVKVFHGTGAAFDVFDADKGQGNDLGFHFGTEQAAQDRLKGVAEAIRRNDRGATGEARVLPIFLQVENPLRLGESRGGTWQIQDILNQIFEAEEVIPAFESDADAYFDDDLTLSLERFGSLEEVASWDMDSRSEQNRWLDKYLKSKGFDGIIYENQVENVGSDSYIVFNPNQIKSADPATYDDQGNLIPLSERFDTRSDDIRRMPAPRALPDATTSPEALPILYKVAGNGQFAKKKGKLIPAAIPYALSQGDFVDEVHPEPIDPTIAYLETDERHYNLTGPALATLRTLAENGSVDHAASILVGEATKALQIPEIKSGLGWYSRMREKLSGALGKYFDIFTQLLGATSAKTPVELNFSYGVEALEMLKSGAYDSNIEGYLKLRVAVQDGLEATRTLLEQEGVKITAKDKTVKQLATKFIKAKKLTPLRANGKKYGSNSNAVLKVLGGVWFEEASSPKTPQFAMNLFGTSLRATIDVWAARTLRRIFYGGTERWRIQPTSEGAVSNLDFALGQMVFARAADQLGMNPDDLQALMWFAEKDVWAKNGWTGEIGAFKGSFDQAAEVYFPVGKPARRLDHGRNVITFLQKRRLVEHDETLPAAETKKEANLRKNHAKELREAEAQPGVREWLVEAGEAQIR